MVLQCILCVLSFNSIQLFTFFLFLCILRHTRTVQDKQKKKDSQTFFFFLQNAIFHDFDTEIFVFRYENLSQIFFSPQNNRTLIKIKNFSLIYVIYNEFYNDLDL